LGIFDNRRRDIRADPQIISQILLGNGNFFARRLSCCHVVGTTDSATAASHIRRAAIEALENRTLLSGSPAQTLFYVPEHVTGSSPTIGEYDGNGNTVNGSLVTSGLALPTGIAVSGADVFVADATNGTIVLASSVSKGAKIQPNKPKVFHLHFKVLSDLTAGVYFPYVSVTLGDVNTTAVSSESFTVG
jgi:hypothetical protein